MPLSIKRKSSSWRERFATASLLTSLLAFPVAATASSNEVSSPSQFARDICVDQQTIWTSPLRLREVWVPTLAVAGVTGTLIAFDPQAAFFRHTSRFRTFNRLFSGTNTALTTGLVPLSWFALGYARQDPYAEKTSLLAAQAVIDGEIVVGVLNLASQRLRPSDISPDGDFAHTFFKKGGITGSFPSGHTIAAFSVATIFAERYADVHWVPWVAYGTATAIGFSRLTLQSHFPSDIFIGAALGYVISRYVGLTW